jgi:hypothetical protein
MARYFEMITKTFILAKEIRAIRTKKLRRNKMLRDHEPLAGAIGQTVRRAAREARASSFAV